MSIMIRIGNSGKGPGLHPQESHTDKKTPTKNRDNLHNASLNSFSVKKQTPGSELVPLRQNVIPSILPRTQTFHKLFKAKDKSKE